MGFLPIMFLKRENQGQVSGMYIYIYIYIKCNRCIYKSASKLSTFCIAIVYFPVLHQGSIYVFSHFYELLTNVLFLLLFQS